MPTHLILALLLYVTVWQPDETLRRYGAANVTWQVQTLNGAPFTTIATLSFPRRNVITGRGPCNRFNTTNTTPYPWFKAAPIAATRMACPDLAEESAFFKALAEATIAIVTDDTLTFSTEDTELLTLKARD
jgi:heat shock protein HslJ